MTRAARIALLAAMVVLAGAGCAGRQTPSSTAGDQIKADIQEMDEVVAGTDAEDFSEEKVADLDVTVEDDAADIDDAVKDADPSEFDDSGLSDDALDVR